VDDPAAANVANVTGTSDTPLSNTGTGDSAAQRHADEPHAGGTASKLNWLRAGVLGANDGIVSTAGLVIGVAATTNARGPILIAGIAGLTAGAAAMALGEYVSVSSQRDTERALLDKERRELAEEPERELAELAAIYQAKGLSPQTARQVAEELTAGDAFAAHVHAELGIDPDELTNPWHAAIASAIAFSLGALLPILAIVAPPAAVRIPITFVVVLLALALTGSTQRTSRRFTPAPGRHPDPDRRRACDDLSPTASANSSARPESTRDRPAITSPCRGRILCQTADDRVERRDRTCRPSALTPARWSMPAGSKPSSPVDAASRRTP